MHSRWRIKYNRYFLTPFLLWICVGAVILMNFTRQQLFFSINNRYSDLGDVFMFYITWLGQAEVIIPVLLALMLIPQFRNKWYLLTTALCNLVPFLVHHFLKSWLNHPRPRLLYRDMLKDIHFLPDWPELLHSGFPSGHSQGAFSFFCFLSLLLPQRYRAFGLLFFVLAMLVAYSRIYLAAHFFDDVYAGSIFGTMSTTLVFSVVEYFRKRSEQKNAL